MSTSVSRQTTEMRISEVLISSRLTPASASAPKNFAETPGCERMPAPTSDTLPMCWSKLTSAKPTVCLTCSSAAIARRAVALGQREGDVGELAGLGRDVLHDHVDVDLGVGEDAEDLRRLARAGRARRRR